MRGSFFGAPQPAQGLVIFYTEALIATPSEGGEDPKNYKLYPHVVQFIAKLIKARIHVHIIRPNGQGHSILEPRQLRDEVAKHGITYSEYGHSVKRDLHVQSPIVLVNGAREQRSLILITPGTPEAICTEIERHCPDNVKAHRVPPNHEKYFESILPNLANQFFGCRLAQGRPEELDMGEGDGHIDSPGGGSTPVHAGH